MSDDRSADPMDQASLREQQERDLRIADARNTIVIHPVLDCPDCEGIEQDVAKSECQFYRSCIDDVERESKAKKIGGIK